MTKIIVTTRKGGLEDSVSKMFAGCQTFTILEIDQNKIISSSIVSNPGHQATAKNGTVAAEKVLSLGVNAVITGKCGPHAIGILSGANILIYPFTGTVRQAMDDFLAGKLTPVTPVSKPVRKGRMGLGRILRAGRAIGRFGI